MKFIQNFPKILANDTLFRNFVLITLFKNYYHKDRAFFFNCSSINRA